MYRARKQDKKILYQWLVKQILVQYQKKEHNMNLYARKQKKSPKVRRQQPRRESHEEAGEGALVHDSPAKLMGRRDTHEAFNGPRRLGGVGARG